MDDPVTQPRAQAGSRSEQIARAIGAIEDRVRAQLEAILAHPLVRNLEATWLQLHELVEGLDQDHAEQSGESPSSVRVQMLDVSWTELRQDLDADEQTSDLYRELYFQRFDMANGTFFSLLVGLFEVPGTVEDLRTTKRLSEVAESVFAPLILGAHPHLIGTRDDFSSLERDHVVARIHEASTRRVEAADLPLPLATRSWHALRDAQSSRFLALTLPRLQLRGGRPERVSRALAMACARCHRWRLARVPSACPECGMHAAQLPALPERIGFPYCERALDTDHRIEGPAAGLFARLVARSFLRTGWFDEIVTPAESFDPSFDALDSAGRLPDRGRTPFRAERHGAQARGRLELAIAPGNRARLSEAGFLPFVQEPGASGLSVLCDDSVHRGPGRGQPAPAPRHRIQDLLASSRFAHALRRMARRRVGSGISATDLERELSEWLARYVGPATASPHDARPLTSARVTLAADDENPGTLIASFQLELRHSEHEAGAAIALATRLHA